MLKYLETIKHYSNNNNKNTLEIKLMQYCRRWLILTNGLMCNFKQLTHVPNVATILIYSI